MPRDCQVTRSQEPHLTLKSGDPKQLVSVSEMTLFRMCVCTHTLTCVYKQSFLLTRFLLSPNKLNKPLKFSEACPCVGEEGKMGLNPALNHPEEGELKSEYILALAFQ